MRAPVCLAALVGICSSHLAFAQDAGVTYSLNGAPGLLEMPTAQSADAGALAATFSYADGLARTTFTFQITDRLSGSLRYSIVDLYGDPTSTIVDGVFERGFDLRYRFNDETTYLPAIAIGLRDFLTPGRFGSEYLVASKTIGEALTVSAGLGWGAMGTRDGFDNPLGGLDAALDTRPIFDESTPEGQLASSQWFHGDAALFGGVEYQINESWGIKAEYASIAYPQQAFAPAVDVETPYNLGVTYRPRDGVQVGLAYLYGTEVALSGTFSLNANNRPGMSGRETAPVPVKVTATNSRAAATWDRAVLPEPVLQSALRTLLEAEGITLSGLNLTDTTARVRYVNGRYRSQAQAMGRVARLMTQVLPAPIQTFTLIPEDRGMPLSATTIMRRDLEQLENQPQASQTMFDRAVFADARDSAPPAIAPSNWTWGLGSYFAIIPFNEGGSVRVDAGLTLRGIYTIRPNLVIAGALGQSVINAAKDDPIADSTPDVQNVRTDGGYYGDDGVPVLQTLTVNHYARPARNLYSRVSLGYLERMFGGVSGELLWKPVDSHLGIGAELNYAAQRNTDMLFGFDEYDYDTVTGHISAYYDLGNGYHTQLDVGRYLAGDWGATLSVDREFANGFRVGAYVTQTDLSYDDFGDGSYSKGVRIVIPQDFFTGAATRASYSNTFQTQLGDGGARLELDGRLYDVVRDAHVADLSDTWGRFWR